jgi:hypothetical protein
MWLVTKHPLSTFRGEYTGLGADALLNFADHFPSLHVRAFACLMLLNILRALPIYKTSGVGLFGRWTFLWTIEWK